MKLYYLQPNEQVTRRASLWQVVRTFKVISNLITVIWAVPFVLVGLLFLGPIGIIIMLALLGIFIEPLAKAPFLWFTGRAQSADCPMCKHTICVWGFTAKTCPYCHNGVMLFLRVRKSDRKKVWVLHG